MSASMNSVLVLASSLAGAAIAWLTMWLLNTVSSKRSVSGSRYEIERKVRLRSFSATFRWFEPLVEELKEFVPYEPNEGGGLAHVLNNSPELKHWTPQEFRATKFVEAVFVALSIFLLVSATGFVTFAGILALVLLLTYPMLAVKSTLKEYGRRIKILRRRLPVVVDQLALMMEAGGNFEESLRTIVAEDQTHPLNQELETVLHSIDAGRSRREALTDLRDRMSDEDINELVFAITKGEELGTPLNSILSEQAEQMRLKRSQWGEKAAAEAEVQIVFPGMLVMIACLIVIIAPILLPAAFQVFRE